MDIYPGTNDRLLFEKQSELQLIRVYEKLNGFRYLSLNGVQHGGHLPGQPGRLVLPYFRCATAALVFPANPDAHPFIGLGMAAMPSYMRAIQPEAHIEAVEIDPAVVDAAREWFGFCEDEKMVAVAGDGRLHVQTTKIKYDVVFLDAYQDTSVPTHLTTVEFMAEVKAILKPGGVAVSNLWGPAVNPLFNSCVKTLKECFRDIYQLKSYTHNYIFIADDSGAALEPYEILPRAKGVMKRMELGFDLVELIRRQCVRATDIDFPATSLYDISAPVDH